MTNQALIAGDAPVFEILSTWAPLGNVVADGAVFRIFPGQAPQGTPAPYVVYELLANEAILPLADRADAEYQRYAVSCWAETRAQAASMCASARDAFEHWNDGRPYGYIAAGKMETFAFDVRLWCVEFDWGMWTNR